LSYALAAVAVILERHRTTLLGLFPQGLPLLVLAPAAKPELVALCTADDRPASVTATFGPDGRFNVALDRMHENVLLEGLDAVDDPIGFLQAIRTAAPAARLFALVANAASLSGLANFVAGAALAPAHPLVRAELEPLFADAGYTVVRVEALESTLHDAEPRAGGWRLGHLLVAELEPDDLQRVRTDAFVVIADPQP